MKYLNKNKLVIYDKNNTSEKLNFLTRFTLKSKYNVCFYVEELNIIDYNFENKDEFFIKQLKSVFLNKVKNNNLNHDIVKNKTINFLTKNGKKQTAYNLYMDTYKLFSSFFLSKNAELTNNYPLYSTYFEYAQKNKILFYNPVFVYTNIVNVLEPTFVLSLKKTIKTKKNKTKNKEIIISYIKTKNRTNFCLKAIIKYSKSFFFNKGFEKLAFTLLNLFLNNKNSILYKKKLIAYDRLLRLRKTK